MYIQLCWLAEKNKQSKICNTIGAERYCGHYEIIKTASQHYSITCNSMHHEFWRYLPLLSLLYKTHWSSLLPATSCHSHQYWYKTSTGWQTVTDECIKTNQKWLLPLRLIFVSTCGSLQLHVSKWNAIIHECYAVKCNNNNNTNNNNNKSYF